MCGIGCVQTKRAFLQEQCQKLDQFATWRAVKAFFIDIAARVDQVIKACWGLVVKVNETIANAIMHVHDSIVFGLRYILSATCAVYLIPSVLDKSSEEDIPAKRTAADEEIDKINALFPASAQKIDYPTLDTGPLSGVMLTHGPDKNPEQKTLVYLPARHEVWQEPIAYLRKLYEEAKINVHALNYRGTGGSAGFPYDESYVIEDYVRYVRDLIRANVPKDRIILYGRDLGGVVAGKVKERIDAEYEIHLPVLFERSMRSVTALASQTAPICPSVQASIIKGMNWALDAENAMKRLKGRVICISSEDDPEIPIEASMKQGLDAIGERPGLEKIFIKMNENEFGQEFPNDRENPQTNNPHTREFTKREWTEITTAIQNSWGMPV